MKLKFLLYFSIITVQISLAGCVGPSAPQMTPLQIQLMQTKVFDIDKRAAFDSTMMVFQNLGYIISSANYNTGFITAKSPKKTNFWGSTRYNTSTAFVTDLRSDKTSIRINFVNNLRYYVSRGQSGGGMVQNDEPILDAQAYINAFSKIQQQIFVNRGISPIQSQPVKK